MPDPAKRFHIIFTNLKTFEWNARFFFRWELQKSLEFFQKKYLKAYKRGTYREFSVSNEAYSWIHSIFHLEYENLLADLQLNEIWDMLKLMNGKRQLNEIPSASFFFCNYEIHNQNSSALKLLVKRSSLSRVILKNLSFHFCDKRQSMFHYHMWVKCYEQFEFFFF